MEENVIFNEDQQRTIKEKVQEYFDENFKDDFEILLEFEKNNFNTSVLNLKQDKEDGRYQAVQQVYIDDKTNNIVCDVVDLAKKNIDLSVRDLNRIIFYVKLRDELNERRKEVMNEIDNSITNGPFLDEKFFNEEFDYLLQLITEINKKHLHSWGI